MANYQSQFTGAQIDEAVGKVAEATAGVGLLKANNSGQIITAEASDVLNLIRDSLYPVGSIKFETTYTNPGTYLGGTWEIWGSGRFPLGVPINDQEIGGQAELTGGEKSVALNSSQVPPSTVNTFLDIYDAFVPAMTQNTESNYGTVAYLKDRSNGSVTGTVAGGSQAHNNMPPYITCYMWKRTA